MKSADFSDPNWAWVHAEVHERWGRITPFRVGYVAGRLGLDLPNPYLSPRGRTHYDQGYQAGRQSVKGGDTA